MKLAKPNTFTGASDTMDWRKSTIGKLCTFFLVSYVVHFIAAGGQKARESLPLHFPLNAGTPVMAQTTGPTPAPSRDCGSSSSKECQPISEGGDCTGIVDLGRWRNGDPNGFEVFYEDLEKIEDWCAEQAPGCTEGFLSSGCDLSQDLRECIAGEFKHEDDQTNNEKREKLEIEGPFYSEDCSDCHAELSSCVRSSCRGSCISGRTSSSCFDCQDSNNCTNKFIECAGVNPTRESGGMATMDILIIVLSVCGGLCLCVIFNTYESHREALKKRNNGNFGMEDLSKMAQRQHDGEKLGSLPSYYDQPSSNGQVSPFASIPMPDTGGDNENGDASATAYDSMNPDELTPYQRQYMEQQRQMATQGPGDGPPRPANEPPQSLRSQASQPLGAIQTTELRVLYDFRGEGEDELKIQAGTTIWGIEENEGWWLAKTVGGIIGLIPSSYVKVVDVFVPGGAGGGGGGRQNEPTF